ncbi:response regulator transcription factor [Rhodobacter sp. Har01]|uniref:response regulator n=1 Tax=Rhodobacter sp. Har01 TaxID=2883999 RepID=UPI001D082AB3|nr:response regulator transcription factor [Rhodobacter sp. Har01]MCB6178207.1 response regulator transcription factor [Rhodobacter sp. Har01]
MSATDPDDRAAPPQIRVVVADDHPIYRDGLARTLRDAPGIDVVGMAADGIEAARLAADLAPDLVLLDISMPGGGGLGALAAIRALPQPPQVAMLTASEDQEDLVAAMKAGALGYLLKGLGAGELVALVRDLAAGRPYVAPGLASRLLVLMRGRTDRPPPNPLDELSHRESEILRLVAQGRSNREVGEALDLQEKTVKHYMTSILQKLQVRNRVEAAMLAREHGKD